MSVSTDDSDPGTADSDLNDARGMGANGSQKPAEKPPAKSADELEADIVETREALGETVAALTAKADVKSRARARVADVTSRGRAQLHAAQGRGRLLLTRVKDATTDDAGQTTKAVPVIVGLVAVTAVAVGAVLVWRSSRTACDRGRGALRIVAARRTAASPMARRALRSRPAQHAAVTSAKRRLP